MVTRAGSCYAKRRPGVALVRRRLVSLTEFTAKDAETAEKPGKASPHPAVAAVLIGTFSQIAGEG